MTQSQAGTSVRSLGGRKLLFSEADQAIFQLDDGAVRLWDELESGLDPEESSDECRGAGADALNQLRSIRNSGPRIAPIQPNPQRLPTSSEALVLALAEVAVQLDLPAELLDLVEGELGHLKSTAAETHARIVVRDSGDRIDLASGDRRWSCSRREFIPLLKGELLDEVLRSATYEVALHAAALIRNDRLLLLCGSPGAGKTTLAMALTRSGFGMASDDVVLLDSDGLGAGLPFPLAAKSPSWPLVEEFYPDGGRRAHLRPDGQIVSYVLPEDFSASPPRSIAFVLFLDRHPGAVARLQDVDRTEALGALIAEGTARDERLSTAGFEALVRMLNDAHCCRLTYDDLAEAVKAVAGLSS